MTARLPGGVMNNKTVLFSLLHVVTRARHERQGLGRANTGDSVHRERQKPSLLLSILASLAFGCVCAFPASAAIVAPVPASTLTTSSFTVSWDTVPGATGYHLAIGTSVEALAPGKWADIQFLSAGLETSRTVKGVPLNGKKVFMRLWVNTASGTQRLDYSYDTVVGVPDGLAQIISPLPPESLTPNIPIEWDSGNGVSLYFLAVADSPEVLGQLPFANVDFYFGTDTTTTLENLPTDGRPVYVRLWSATASGVSYKDYVYTTGYVDPVALTQPTPEGVLSATSQVFSWQGNVAGATEYMLGIASSPEKLEAGIWGDIFVHSTTNTSVKTPRVLPMTGEKLYVRLWSRIYGLWLFRDYQYATTMFKPAQLLAPTGGGTLSKFSETFSWDAGSGAEFLLALASSPKALDASDKGDIFIYGGKDTSVEAVGIPLNGQNVYARLWSKIGEEWFFTDSQFKTTQVVQADLLQPISGTQIDQRSKRFSWNSVPGADSYVFALATSREILDSQEYGDIFVAPTTDTAAVAIDIPLSGNDIYARLWTQTNGGWYSRDYVFPTVVASSTTASNPLVECQERLWSPMQVAVGGSTRDLLWRVPAGGWSRGAIVLFHGGGGSYSEWCNDTDLTHHQKEFAESALAAGFAVFALDSTDGGFTDSQGLSCGKRFDATSALATNIDLPFVATVLQTIIPNARPWGSNPNIYLTGHSSGGFMATRAATHFDDVVSAFVPVSGGDPYGVDIVCDAQYTERDNVPGLYVDRETQLGIHKEGACDAQAYPNELALETSYPWRLPSFKQLHHRYDQGVNLSCMKKANTILTSNQYPDAGVYISENMDQPAESFHLWQAEYNQVILDYLISVSDAAE